MNETIEISAGRYYARYPLTLDFIELAKKFLDCVAGAVVEEEQ